MKKKKYRKYKTLYLPKTIVEVILVAHQLRTEEYKKVRLDICFDIVNNIIQKSSFNRDENDSSDIFALMSSKYLKLRYKNKYKIHKDFLFINNIIYFDTPIKGKATNFYLQDYRMYERLYSNLTKDSIESNHELDLFVPYCVRNNIELSQLDTINTTDSEFQKNRIIENWYSIKILIQTSNESFLIGNYEKDSVFINNASTYIKKMGSHFRKNFKIDSQAATEHTLRQFQTELKSATNVEEEKRAYNRSLARMNSIMDIHNGKINKSLRFSRNGTNKRIDTNLTNMASDLKPFIVGWDNLAYLDLKNSQPVLFNHILNHHYENGSKDLKTEIDKYRTATFSGRWYEELMEIYNEDREKSKEIWMCIAYSKNTSYKKLKKPFKDAFPNIYKIIEKAKEKDYKNFAISLQKLESELFIDRICKELVDIDIIPFTVHDALIVKQDQKERTLQIMQKVFFEYLEDAPKISLE